MTQKDVVTEVWKLVDQRLTPIWRKQAVGFVTPRLMLCDFDRDGLKEMVTYSLFGKGKMMEAIRPDLGR